MTTIPKDQTITYQLQYRKCGRCKNCLNGPGHGPYWYAYWREGARLRSGYAGKVHPALRNDTDAPSPSTSPCESEVHQDAVHRNFTREQVRDIRARLARGERARTIAQRYKVTDSVVSNIKRGKTYREVQA